MDLVADILEASEDRKSSISFTRHEKAILFNRLFANERNYFYSSNKTKKVRVAELITKMGLQDLDLLPLFYY